MKSAGFYKWNSNFPS